MVPAMRSPPESDRDPERRRVSESWLWARHCPALAILRAPRPHRRLQTRMSALRVSWEWTCRVGDHDIGGWGLVLVTMVRIPHPRKQLDAGARPVSTETPHTRTLLLLTASMLPCSRALLSAIRVYANARPGIPVHCALHTPPCAAEPARHAMVLSSPPVLPLQVTGRASGAAAGGREWRRTRA